MLISVKSLFVQEELGEGSILFEAQKLSKVYVEGLRKGWKKLLGEHKRVKDYESGMVFLKRVQNYLRALTEELLLNFGAWQDPREIEATKRTIEFRKPKRGRRPSRRVEIEKSKLKKLEQFAKPQKLLREAQLFVDDVIYQLEGRRKRLTLGSPEFKMDQQFNPGNAELDFVNNKHGGDIEKYLAIVTKEQIDDFFLKEMDKIVSGKLFRHLSTVAGGRQSLNVSLGRGKEFSTTDYSIGRMKITWKPMRGYRDDHGVNPESLAPSEHEADVDTIRDHAPYLIKAKALLKKKGFDFLWYGKTFVQCLDCGGDNPHGKELGVGANYSSRKDEINIFVKPGPYVITAMIHELGHRFYFKFLRRAERLRFAHWFGDLPFVSSYAEKDAAEEFAETFTWYMLGKNLTRRQLERLKDYFKGIKEDREDVLINQTIPSQKFVAVRSLFERKGSSQTPALLKRCVVAVYNKREDERPSDRLSKAFAICTAQYQKGGSLKKGTQDLTKKGGKKSSKKSSDETHAEKVAEYERILKIAKQDRKEK